MAMSEDLAKKFGYSEKVMDHFKNPRNVGVIEDADITSKVGSISCGDLIKLYLKFVPDQDQIKDIRFESHGCAANIAASSMMTEMVKGKTIEEARNVTFKNISENLGGLPKIKLHCAVLSRQGLETAFLKYEAKRGRVKIDEPFVNKVLCGVLDPIQGADIVSSKLLEGTKIDGNKIVLDLKAKPDSELAKSLTADIHDAFEGLNVDLDLRFKE
jgi:nitrogen fixation NifU-like protein